MLGVRMKGDRPDSNRRPGVHSPGCCPSTPQSPWKDGDDRTRTGGLSPDKRALCAPELRPRERGHPFADAPVMQSGRQESNLRSPAPDAGGVADSPTARRTFVQYPRRDSNPQLPG
jgi:hypothetical protein